MDDKNHAHFSGEEYINTSFDALWKLVNDEVALKEIFPGVKEIKTIGENTYFIEMKTPFWGLPGDIWARLEVNKNEQSGEVYSKIIGSGVGSTFNINLSIKIRDEKEKGIAVEWESDLYLNGRILSLPNPIIIRTSKRMIKKAVANLKLHLRENIK